MQTGIARFPKTSKRRFPKILDTNNPKDQIEVICFLKKINLEQVIQDIKDKIEKQNINIEKIFSNIKIHLVLIIILIIFF